MDALERIDSGFAALRKWSQTGCPLPFVDEGHDFVVSDPMDEAAVHEIEHEHNVSLPAEYRAFIRRFGDVAVGWPGNSFHRVREALTPASKRPFPLDKPFLGCQFPAYQHLSTDRQQSHYRAFMDGWNRIPINDGVLLICDYGCAIYAVLVLNGPYSGQVWLRIDDQVYYGPFGGSEILHEESASLEWSECPREYTFFEWYESWLNMRLKMAGLLPW